MRVRFCWKFNHRQEERYWVHPFESVWFAPASVGIFPYAIVPLSGRMELKARNVYVTGYEQLDRVP